MNVGLFAVVSLIILGLFVHARRRRRSKIIRGRTRALEMVKLLRRLLEHAQRHRGLSYGVMSGERILAGEQWAAQQQVLDILSEAQPYEASLAWYDSWKRVVDRWNDIQQMHQDTSAADTVLRLHNEMVADLIETIRSIAHPHGLVPHGALSAAPAGIWLELLEHSELLGQARAIGTGIAARRQNTPSQRDELARLRERLSKHPYECLAHLQGDPELRPLVSQAVTDTERSLDLLMDLIDKLLAAAAGKSVHSAVYFRAATQAISGLLTLVDMLLNRLEPPNPV